MSLRFRGIQDENGNGRVGFFSFRVMFFDFTQDTREGHFLFIGVGRRGGGWYFRFQSWGLWP